MKQWVPPKPRDLALMQGDDPHAWCTQRLGFLGHEVTPCDLKSATRALHTNRLWFNHNAPDEAEREKLGFTPEQLAASRAWLSEHYPDLPLPPE